MTKTIDAVLAAALMAMLLVFFVGIAATLISRAINEAYTISQGVTYGFAIGGLMGAGAIAVAARIYTLLKGDE